MDFIQSLIQRTPHDRQSFHRLAALKEAYGRATTKQADPPRIPSIPRINLKNTLRASKIRDELEKYNQLPPRDFDSPYYDDETYTIDNQQPAVHPWIVRSYRILNFLTSIKRRAQVNMQQWKKNFQDVRTRIFIEQATMPAARRRHHRPTVRHGCISLAARLDRSLLESIGKGSDASDARKTPGPSINEPTQTNASPISPTSIATVALGRITNARAQSPSLSVPTAWLVQASQDLSHT